MSFLMFFVVAISLLGSACSIEIPFDEVVPFSQLKNASNLQNTLALKFKPQLYITSGCSPYPAVDASGNVNGGLEVYKVFTDCSGSPRGSQVYARVFDVDGYVGIMYLWYFPRDFNFSPYSLNHHHCWQYIIVWLSSLSDNAKLLAVTGESPRGHYSIYSPPTNDQMDGNHVKLKYTSWRLQTSHYLKPTDKDGKYQDLTMWDDMTDAAREALENTTFYGSKAPISNGRYRTIFRLAYPF